MTVTVTVTNFRGCAKAEFQCAPIALLTGLNGAGKTSVCQAIAAALTGNTLPVAGLRTNASGGLLVRTGAATGSVEIATEEGTCRVAWPEMRRTTEGKPPESSEYAAGLLSIATLTPKDRLGVIVDYLRAAPTAVDLSNALDEAGLDAERVLEAVWPTIQHEGWDAAVTQRRERGQQLKGQWRQATSANWGSRVAASWRPDLADLDRGTLENDVANLRQARDRAVAAEAVSDAERSRLEDEAALYDARADALERATARSANYSSAYQAAQTARAALPTTERETTIPCPYCGEPIVINKVSLVETRFEKADTKPLDSAELRQRRTAIAEADGKLAHASDDLATARREMSTGEAAVRASLEARERLDNWPRAVETGTSREAIETRLAEAEKRLADLSIKIEADRLHGLIEGNEIVVDLLAADGLRAKKLDRVLEVFDATLAALCATAQWQAVRLDAGGGMTYGDRPYPLLSSSEQYRVRTILAAAMAQIDGSAMLIFDGADILDPPSRSGLIALIDELAIPALVAMTLRRNHVPDLAAAGDGNSYWLAGGVVEPIGERIAA